MDKPTPPDLLTARMSSSEYVLLGVWGQEMAAWGAAQERARADDLLLSAESEPYATARLVNARRAYRAAARRLTVTTETTWRDEFDVVLKTIVLPGEFDILDATDRSRWLGALQQSYDAGRNKAEQYKEDAEHLLSLLTRYRNEVPLGHQPPMLAHIVDAAIDKARGK